MLVDNVEQIRSEDSESVFVEKASSIETVIVYGNLKGVANLKELLAKIKTADAKMAMLYTG